MGLFAIRDQLKSSGPSTAAALAGKIHASPVVVEGMLEHWIHRGLVEVVEAGCLTGGMCRTCGACAMSRIRWYRWQEPALEKPDMAAPVTKKV